MGNPEASGFVSPEEYWDYMTSLEKKMLLEYGVLPERFSLSQLEALALVRFGWSIIKDRLIKEIANGKKSTSPGRQAGHIGQREVRTSEQERERQAEGWVQKLIRKLSEAYNG